VCVHVCSNIYIIYYSNSVLLQEIAPVYS